MLVLTRKSGETIRLGRDIEIVLLKAANGKAKIGIVAPRDVSVARAKEERRGNEAD